jgi:cytochrome c
LPHPKLLFIRHNGWMKLTAVLLFGAIFLAGTLVRAEDQSITGIVTTRYVQPNGQTMAFILVDPDKPTVEVTASGADADALVPRNQVMLSATMSNAGADPVLMVKAGSVMVNDTNQPFKSLPITAAALKEATTYAGDYVQLPGVMFTADKFDNSGTAQVKTDDGSVVSLLVGKGAAGRETPKDMTDVFGVVVKSGNEWKLVATRFLASNRKDIQALATKDTCLTCHNPDTKLVGPPYRDVAAKYKDDPNADAEIIAQMQNGGSGKWGETPMPPLKTVVPPDDMPKLAGWILSYRWDAILAE